MEKGGGREQEGAKEGDHDHHDDEDYNHDHHDDEDDNHDDQYDHDHNEYDNDGDGTRTKAHGDERCLHFSTFTNVGGKELFSCQVEKEMAALRAQQNREWRERREEARKEEVLQIL